jgi:LmbE family N-acetylglucosaminyl deacetylase
MGIHLIKYMADMTTLIFSPHPDDETLGCGGSIAARRSSGEEVYIVFMTDGRYGSPLPEERGSKELIETRKKEALNALEILGVKKDNIYFLDFEDGHLNKSKKLALLKVEDIIKTVKPNNIYFTSHIDAHPDHSTTGEIVRKAIRNLNINVKQYSFMIWKPRLIARDLNISIKFIKSYFYKPRIEVVDISKYLNIKLKALEEYKSQVKWFSKEFLSRFTTNYEIFFI